MWSMTTLTMAQKHIIPVNLVTVWLEEATTVYARQIAIGLEKHHIVSQNTLAKLQ